MNNGTPGKLLRGIMLMGLSFFSAFLSAQNSGITLEQGFKVPPPSAWPRTWWHWTNSNITKDGITKDLEWMKRVGIAGLQLADVAFGSGQAVDKKIIFGTPEWLDALKHTAVEAERLDLEMAMFTSAGWSLTGGSWVKPEQAMKKLVWSELTIEGGKLFNGKLPSPPSNEGPIRNLYRGGKPPENGQGFYGDCAVIAFKTPAEEQDLFPLLATATTNMGTVDASALWDDDLNTTLVIKPLAKRGPAWIQYTFTQPTKVKAITIGGTKGIPYGRLLGSEDGKKYKILVALPGKQGYRGGTVRTFAFPETSARYFRLELEGAPMKPAEVISEATPQPDTLYSLNELKLYAGARVHRWEDKAGFNFLFEYENTATPQVAPNAVINQADILDITAKVSKDGTLRWNVPKGKWTIMRFGYSLTGAKNRPAVPSALGYEVDKLSLKYTKDYIRRYTEPLAKVLGPQYGKRLGYMMMDSWEAGIQNWTDEMVSEFQKRRGYDPTPFLPVMAGHVVNSANVSDRFLWDFRRTLVDMFAENHYKVITEFLNQQGIQTYGEAGGVSLEAIEDALLYKKYVDIPMGEFWIKDLHPSSMYYEDVRGAASASHVYGKTLVAAEAFTGGNYEAPYRLKKISDYWFTQGINRLVFHTSAHQPLDTKPGNAMVGTHLHRNITWAEFAKPMMTYMARNSFMLQQGLYVADFAYLLNEGAPSTMPFWGAGLQPALPEGYQFDYINADALLTRMAVDSNSRLVLPDGMKYSVLVLPQTDLMTLPVLRKIKELVAGGATVVGPKPTKAPGLSGYPDSDREIKELANELWGDLDGTSRTRHPYGKGKVFWGLPLEQVATTLEIAPDVVSSSELDSKLSWIHRQTGEKDIYFLVNGTDKPQDFKVRFKIKGRDVSLWNSATGETTPAGYNINGAYTTVALHLKERETVFVVFSGKASDTARAAMHENLQLLSSIKGPWKVHFAPNMGAPEEITMDSLISWTVCKDSGIKYYSGTAIYSKTFGADRKWLSTGKRILLDLGKVGDVAEVTLNGTQLGILWMAPFQLDITKVLKQGKNTLSIKVINEWTNRLIGDKFIGSDHKVLDAYITPFGSEYQLSESGLIGPVKIVGSLANQ